MLDGQPQPNPNVSLYGPGRPKRAKTFRVRLDLEIAHGLERAAAARGLPAEFLLAAIGRVVVTDRLIDAVLDTTSLYSLFRAFHARGFPDRGFPDRS